MTGQRHDFHERHVAEWEKINCAGLGPEPLLHLYANAIEAIERRSLATLSSVTVKVVVDRVLHELSPKYSVLFGAVIEADRLNLKPMLEKNHSLHTEQTREALRAVLLKLLNVFGNITADVLTVPLHLELMEVRSLKAVSTPESKGKKS